MSGNQALTVNNGVGGSADLQITNHGSDWYWTVCAIMGVSTLAFMAMSFSKPRSHRLFHYITASITLVACIAYYSMGSGLGQTPVVAEFMRPNSNTVYAAGTREFFYVRYIDWVVTTPLLLLDLLLTAGLPTPTIAITILMDEVMIITGLVGALTPTSYKWGYWVFGMMAFFYVIYSLVFIGRSHARAFGPDPARAYNMCGVLTIGIWFLYPIAWGLAEGGNVIHPDSEAVFYGILDIIAKPIFGFMLLYGHRNISPAQLGLVIKDVEEHESTHHEKRGLFGSKRGATNGTGATNAPATDSTNPTTTV